MKDITDFVHAFVEQMQCWPSAVLLFFVLIVLGWALKISAFPNRFIPLAVLGAGSGLNLLIGDVGKVDPTQRNPQVILAMWGLCIAFVAWTAHNTVLWRLEKYVPLLRDSADPAPGAGDKTKTP